MALGKFQKYFGKLLSLLILIPWTAIFFYPAAWHIIHSTERITRWTRLTKYNDDKALPFTDLVHKMMYPNHNAVIKGRLDRINWKGLDDVELNRTDSFNFTLIGYSAALNDAAIVGSLLKLGADPNLQMLEGNTALHFASKKNYEKVIELLMRYEGKVDVCNNKGETALHYAAEKEISQIFLNADPYTTNFEVKDIKGLTPLDWAAKKNKFKSVIDLVLAGAEPACNLKKIPPYIDGFLMLCARTGDPYKAAQVIAEKDPNHFLNKLKSRFNLPAEMPVDFKYSPIKLRGKQK